MYIGSKLSNEFEKYMFYEALTTSDHIILTNDHILDLLDLSKNEDKQVIRLLEKGDISIVSDFLPFVLRKHDDINIMIELEVNTQSNSDALFKSDRFIKRDLSTRRIIEKKVVKIDYPELDIEGICQFICGILK